MATFGRPNGRLRRNGISVGRDVLGNGAGFGAGVDMGLSLVTFGGSAGVLRSGEGVFLFVNGYPCY